MDTVDPLAVRRNHNDPGVLLTPAPAAPRDHVVISRPLPAVMELPPIGKANAVRRNVIDMEQPLRRSAPLLTGFGAKF